VDSNVIDLSLFEFLFESMGYLFSLAGIHVPIVFSLWRASKYPLFFSLSFLAHASLAWHILFGSCFFGMASFISLIFA
jgi:hypothetical protein